MIRNFEDLWKEHFEYNRGILLKEIKFLKTVDIYLGNTSDEWYNFALPKTEPENFDLKEIQRVLTPVSSSATVYLLEKYAKLGFPEYLLQNGYEFFGSDTWMVFDNKAIINLETSVSVERVNLLNFSDYDQVTTEVFEEEGFDERPYNRICQESLAGVRKSKNPDFSSEFFMIYQDSKPAAGAGLFLTKEIGYFHNDATLPEFRGKGYHEALIKKRIDFCLERGIKTLYSMVEYQKQSFKNYSKCGFESWQLAQMFVQKGKDLK
ncbi:MAG: GNAT family N-acetyltransferase [bacterium]|nr:GNAT family N-acetyltransferase [bacterium]